MMDIIWTQWLIYMKKLNVYYGLKDFLKDRRTYGWTNRFKNDWRDL